MNLSALFESGWGWDFEWLVGGTQTAIVVNQHIFDPDESQDDNHGIFLISKFQND